MTRLDKIFEETIEVGFNPESDNNRQLFIGKLMDALKIDVLSEDTELLIEFGRISAIQFLKSGHGLNDLVEESFYHIKLNELKDKK